MTWFDIRYNGVTYVENLTGADEKVLVGLGFHGYATQVEAEAHPNNANILQMAVASNILAGHPTGGVNTPGAPAIANTAQGAGAAAAAAANPLGQIGDFFHRLTEGSTWIRVGEVAAGILLLYIGLKAVTTPGGASVANQTVKKTAVRVLRKTPARAATIGRGTRKVYRRGAETAIRHQERKVGIRARHRAPSGTTPAKKIYVVSRGRHSK